MLDSDKMSLSRRVQLLKDVFTLIQPELLTRRNRLSLVDNAERRDRLASWMLEIKQATVHGESAWAEEEHNGRSKRGRSLMPQLIQQLREVMLTHQWTEVLSILDCLTYVPREADWATFKASLSAFYTEPTKNHNLIQDLFKNAYLLEECNVRDVVLEFAIYLLSQGKASEASQVIQKVRKVRRGARQADQRKFTQYLIDLLDGYQGLIYYIQWKEALHNKAESSQNTDLLSQSFYSLPASQALSEDAVKSIAERALLGLDNLQTKPGVWDIFLTKTVEIRTFYKDYDTCRKMLQTYRERNPDNPNAHRFLYDLLQNNKEMFEESSAEEEILSCLKSLVKLDPASPLMLTLWKVLTDQGSTADALCCMFDLLDHSAWKDSADAWQSFVKSLTTGLSRLESEVERQSFAAELRACCGCRKDWWPAYHFPPRAVVQFLSVSPSPSIPVTDSLMLAKCTAAGVLLGLESSFFLSAKAVLSPSSLRNLENTLSNMDLQLLKDSLETGDLLRVGWTQSMPAVSLAQSKSQHIERSNYRESDFEDSLSVVSSVGTTEWLKNKKTPAVRRPLSEEDSEAAVDNGSSIALSEEDLELYSRKLAAALSSSQQQPLQEPRKPITKETVLKQASSLAESLTQKDTLISSQIPSEELMDQDIEYSELYEFSSQPTSKKKTKKGLDEPSVLNSSEFGKSLLPLSSRKRKRNEECRSPQKECGQTAKDDESRPSLLVRSPVKKKKKLLFPAEVGSARSFVNADKKMKVYGLDEGREQDVYGLDEGREQDVHPAASLPSVSVPSISPKCNKKDKTTKLSKHLTVTKAKCATAPLSLLPDRSVVMPRTEKEPSDTQSSTNVETHSQTNKHEDLASSSEVTGDNYSSSNDSGVNNIPLCMKTVTIQDDNNTNIMDLAKWSDVSRSLTTPSRSLYTDDDDDFFT